MTITTEIRGHAGIILMGRPPVNAINHDIRASVIAALARLAEEASLDRIVLAEAGRIFTAGADAGEFNAPPTDPTLPQVIAAIEASPLPVVAAIRGACLGGGLERRLPADGVLPIRRRGSLQVILGVVPGQAARSSCRASSVWRWLVDGPVRTQPVSRQGAGCRTGGCHCR